MTSKLQLKRNTWSLLLGFAYTAKYNGNGNCKTLKYLYIAAVFIIWLQGKSLKKTSYI